jgi:outer membrane protein TolC
VCSSDLVKRTRFYLEFTNNQLKQQEERYAKKVISGAEISMARLTAEQAQIALERTEFDFDNAKASFARLAGLGVVADEAIPESIPALTYAAGVFDQLLAGFLAQKDPPTAEAFTLRHQLEVENLNYANQKTRLWPKFNAVLGTNQDEQSYTQNITQKYQVTSIFGGVSASWTIFDGFSSGAAVRNSLAHRRQLENDYRQVTARLAQDAQSQVKQLNFSARNMSIYDRFLSSSEASLVSVQADFHRGVKSEADVSQSQLSLYDAQLNAANARIDYLLKIGDFLGTVTGDPILANLAEK